MSEYKKPGFGTRAANQLVMLVNRLGISPSGAHTLVVRGRSSGEDRTAPVNPLELEGQRYLVAPRGETHWVRNLRADPNARLRLGRKTEPIRAFEVPEAEKPVIISAYLERWGGVTREHFGASEHPDDDELTQLAVRTPVFRIEKP